MTEEPGTFEWAVEKTRSHLERADQEHGPQRGPLTHGMLHCAELAKGYALLALALKPGDRG